VAAAPRRCGAARRDRAAALRATEDRVTTRSRWLAIVALALLPLVWVWPSVFGDRRFVPWDLAEFPPASLSLPADEVAAIGRRGNHDVTEVPIWFLPEMEFARDELLAGRWPAWNPHARGGTVLHAHGLIGILYPPNWVAMFAADPESRLGLVAWINLALGGLLAFGLLRELGIAPFAAWLGAALFELSAPMATNAFFWMRLASFVWLPGVLWSVLRLTNANALRAGPVAALSASIAMAWLGGFPPFATTTSVIGAMFAAWLVVVRVRAQSLRDGTRLALRLGAGFALGALLAMPQVLPSLQFFPHSARTPNPTRAEIEQQSFETYGLLGYLVPDLIGHPTAAAEIPYTQSPVALLLGTRHDETGKQKLPIYNYTEYAVFVGTFGLLLAIAGAFAGRGRHRAFAVAAFLLLAGLALFAPGVNLLFAMPVVKNVWPLRWLAPATLFVGWLAALGCERLREESRRLPLALAGVAAALASGIVWLTRRHAAWYERDPAGLVAEIASWFRCSPQDVVNHVQGVPPVPFDRFALAFARATEHGELATWWLAGCSLVLAAIAFARGRPREWLLRAAAVATLLQLAMHGAPIVRGCERDHPSDSAVHTFLHERAAAAASNGGFTIVRGSTAPVLPSQLPAGGLMAPGLRDLHAYRHYDARSHRPLLAMLAATLGKDTAETIAGKGYLTQTLPDALLAHPLLDLLGVRYVLAVEPLAHAGARVGPELRSATGEFFVFERPHPLPRAFTVPALRALPTDDAVVAALADPQVAPRAAALVVTAEEPANARSAPVDAPPRDVRFVTDLPGTIELRVAAGDAPWLVLADTFLPGWSATIDGEPAAIVRANHAQRAVAIPERACTVRFTYTSPGLAAGSLLAGIATLALVVLFVRTTRRDRAATSN